MWRKIRKCGKVRANLAVRVLGSPTLGAAAPEVGRRPAAVGGLRTVTGMVRAHGALVAARKVALAKA